MTRKKAKTKNKHEFEKLPEFHRAMRKLIGVPKEQAKERDETEQNRKNR